LKKLLYILLTTCFHFTAFGQAFLSNNGGLISIKDGAMLSARGDVINSNGGEFHNSDTIYCNKHWINNGGNEAFTSTGEGIVIFYGAAQRITGSDITRFYDLRLTGSDIKYGDLDVFVDGFLRLNDREFNLDVNTVHVFSSDVNAVSQQGGFVSSLQSGGLLRNTASTQAYSFPVGSSLGVTRFRPVDLTLSSASPNTFKVRMANVDATVEGYDRAIRNADICEVNPQFYHRIYREQGTDSAIVAIHYDPPADGNWDSLVHWQNIPQWEITGDVTQSTNPAYNLTAITSTNYIDNFTHPAFALAQIADSITLTYTDFCDGNTSTLTADIGYSNYDIYVNGVLVQSGPSNTYTGVLNQGDIIHVITDANSFCTASSREIIVQSYTNSIALTVNNPTICNGDNQIYTATPGFLNYDFYVNGTLVQSGPSNTYTVTGLSNGDNVYVSGTDVVCDFESNNLQVVVFSAQIGLTTDPPIFCENQPITFIASTGFINYDFYVNGILQQSGNSNTYLPITIQDGDSVNVIVADANCNYTSTAVYIQYNSQTLVLTASATDICSGAAIDFTADPGFDTYDFLINGVLVQGSTANTYTTNQLSDQDSVWVIATIDSCQYTSNVMTITVFPGVAANAYSDTTIVQEESVQIFATGGDFYDWMPAGTLSCDDCSDPIATPDSTTLYVVTVENINGCTAVDSVLVSIVPFEEGDANIPNAFSPNGDSKNDTWHISYLDAYPDNEVVVLNRWGDQLFYAKPYIDEFDGTFQGRPLPRGTYYFILKVEVNNELKIFKGPLTIVR